MSGYTLERRLAAPVACENCHWHGATGELKGRSRLDDAPFSCPRCGRGWALIWIEGLSTATLQ
jgi:hypothetical protein